MPSLEIEYDTLTLEFNDDTRLHLLVPVRNAAVLKRGICSCDPLSFKPPCARICLQDHRYISESYYKVREFRSLYE